MSDPELKPCPKCNSEALLDSIEHQRYEGCYDHYVSCKSLKCNIETGSYETEEAAIKAWNNGLLYNE